MFFTYTDHDTSSWFSVSLSSPSHFSSDPVNHQTFVYFEIYFNNLWPCQPLSQQWSYPPKACPNNTNLFEDHRKLNELSWCQLCCYWWHCRLSLWQPAVPPVTTKLASWQLSIFAAVKQTCLQPVHWCENLSGSCEWQVSRTTGEVTMVTLGHFYLGQELQAILLAGNYPPSKADY